MGINKTQQAIYENRKKKAVDIYNKLNGDISMKELAEKIGVSVHMANYYISSHFKVIRGNKF